jgi:hypothetical protein
MLKYFNIYKKEVKRITTEESYYTHHNKIWKYFFKWKRLAESNSVKSKLPWISFPVIDFLEENLKPQSKVFEFGGGGSTLFFLDRVKEVVTVEHNKEWFDILSSNINDKSKWTPLFIEPVINLNFNSLQFANPDAYFSSDKDYVNMDFKSYACSIDNYEDGYFDFVLVDGRVRPSCMKHSISKIKKGGYLILDNSDRAYYLEYFLIHDSALFEEIINYSGPTPFCTWFNRTSIWKKK